MGELGRREPDLRKPTRLPKPEQGVPRQGVCPRPSHSTRSRGRAARLYQQEHRTVGVQSPLGPVQPSGPHAASDTKLKDRPALPGAASPGRAHASQFREDHKPGARFTVCSARPWRLLGERWTVCGRRTDPHPGKGLVERPPGQGLVRDALPVPPTRSHAFPAEHGLGLPQTGGRRAERAGVCARGLHPQAGPGAPRPLAHPPPPPGARRPGRPGPAPGRLTCAVQRVRVGPGSDSQSVEELPEGARVAPQLRSASLTSDPLDAASEVQARNLKNEERGRHRSRDR